MQYYSELTKNKDGKVVNNDYITWNLKSVDELKGRNDVKADYPTGDECYEAQERNHNEYAAGQYCIVKDTETGMWAILLELDHWEFSHFMPYNGCGMGTLGLYTTAKVAKQNAHSRWPNAKKVHSPRLMTKPVYREYLEII